MDGDTKKMVLRVTPYESYVFTAKGCDGTI
jgi:hypothetical protein